MRPSRYNNSLNNLRSKYFHSSYCAAKVGETAKKQKKEQKLTRLGIESLFSALGPIFSSDSLDNACYVGYLTRRSNHRKS